VRLRLKSGYGYFTFGLNVAVLWPVFDSVGVSSAKGDERGVNVICSYLSIQRSSVARLLSVMLIKIADKIVVRFYDRAREPT
jgi:hypothetical protein